MLLLFATAVLALAGLLVVGAAAWLNVEGFDNSPTDQTTIRYEVRSRLIGAIVLGFLGMYVAYFALRGLWPRVIDRADNPPL